MIKKLDEYGVAPLIGIILIFGAAVVAFAVFQAEVIPSLNEREEISHNEGVQDSMINMQSSIRQSVVQNSPSSSSIDLGVVYTQRFIFANPPPASGRVFTSEPSQVAIQNSVAVNGQKSQYWNGSTKSYDTRTVEYSPDYNEYRNSPRTVMSGRIVYNSFTNERSERANLTVSNQGIVSGNSITILTIRGDLEKRGFEDQNIQIQPQSAPMESHTIEDNGNPVTILFASELSESQWREQLQGERTQNGGYVTSVSKTNNIVSIQFAQNATYRLRLGHVQVGDPDNEIDGQPIPAYIIKTGGDANTISPGSSAQIETTVYDQYGNPISGSEVTAEASGGSFSNGDSIQTQMSDSNGKVTYLLSTNSDQNSDITINTSLNDPNIGFNSADPKDAQYEIYVLNQSGGGSDTTSPVASIDNVQITSRGGQGNDRFDITVDWSATDNNDLSDGSVNEIRLIDETGSTVETQSVSPTGTSDSGQIEFANIRGPFDGWSVEFTVSDSADNQDTDTVNL